MSAGGAPRLASVVREGRVLVSFETNRTGQHDRDSPHGVPPWQCPISTECHAPASPQYSQRRLRRRGKGGAVGVIRGATSSIDEQNRTDGRRRTVFLLYKAVAYGSGERVKL